MITKFSWRRAVAVPAVLTLALGGALLSTTAANAADGMLDITSPTDGGATTSRDVSIVGTAVPGASINVFTDDTRTTRLVQTTTDTTTGAFTAVLPSYPVTAPREQSVFVDGVVGGSGFSDAQPLSFVLPIGKYLTLETPVANTPTGSRDVVFSGTATEGSTVIVSSAGVELGRANLGNGTTYSIPFTYADAAATAQTVTVTGIVGGSGLEPVTRDFTLPAVVTPPTTPVTLPAPVITAPAQGATVTGTEVTFEGTGTPGADIGLVVTPTDSVSTLADDPAARIVVDENGDWTVTAALQPGDYTAVAVQVLLDAAGQPVLDEDGLPVASDDSTPVDFTLEAAAVVLDAPVITSPTQGQVVVGDQVTFEGTGTPGSNILLAVVPTDQLDELEAAENGRAAAAAVPADPADPIVVDAAGNWTVTLALTPNDYTAAAVSFLLDADGAPVLDAAGQPIVSAPSADVAFSLVAAVTPAALPATPIATGTTGLAYTGSEGTEAAIGIGAAVLLLGSTLMVLARRRAKLATTDVAGE
ncbi:MULTISPECIES: hypothetical protein [Frigoribacterium]|uniref:hypothetical protein n=1 Tax=Frigoribacterium TaxID=96492 RepID=UPI000F4A6A7D|nr:MULTISPECIES: hypothetical protein [Frigoribacterium]MBD8141600.1 hypothetical protein [Frigoribacterium sp. CFBP 13605]ROS57075.1 hypothetical protein EDF21_0728 [Frigoribacterium sp. PhB118]